MQKLKQFWLLICLVIILLGAAFYWFQYRPYKAKKDCAWKRMHVDAILYKPAAGSLEAVSACEQQCDQRQLNNPSAFANLFCKDDCNKLYTPERNAEPQKDWWAQTSDSEYKSCLRGRGF